MKLEEWGLLREVIMLAETGNAMRVDQILRGSPEQESAWILTAQRLVEVIEASGGDRGSMYLLPTEKGRVAYAEFAAAAWPGHIDHIKVTHFDALAGSGAWGGSVDNFIFKGNRYRSITALAIAIIENRQ